MAKFALPPTGAKNVDMQDGTRYRGTGTMKHGRVIQVDRPDHARAMGSQESLTRMADFAGAAVEMKATRECIPCHFTAWPWTTQCPKCGESTTEVAE